VCRFTSRLGSSHLLVTPASWPTYRDRHTHRRNTSWMRIRSRTTMYRCVHSPSLRIKSSLRHISDYSGTIHESYYYWLMIIPWNRSYFFRFRTHGIFFGIVAIPSRGTLVLSVYEYTRILDDLISAIIFYYRKRKREMRRERCNWISYKLHYKITVIIFSNHAKHYKSLIA